jgi:ferrochelatase
MKIAVVLFNLGGPDSPESIRPFLKNFFMDKNIIQAPLPIRVLVSSLIASRRSKNQAGEAYGLMGGKSPLLENTQAQAAILEQTLTAQDPTASYKTFIAMRYWNPLTAETVAKIKAWGAERIILLPLYPQYSTTTTFSALETWRKEAAAAGLTAAETVFCCYPQLPGFVEASARLIRETYEGFVAVSGMAPRVLFSAHGLPEKIIQQGDPYQWQCEESARVIAEATGIENLDWSICYQSRVGPLKWIGPSTEDALVQAAQDEIPVLIYPHAFVSEHVETLVEIEIEYRHLAEELGVPGFARIPTVSVSEEFIDGLAAMVIEHKTHNGLVPAAQPCGKEWSRCCQNETAKICKKAA